MKLKNVPFNIAPMNNSRAVIKNLQPITSVDIYDGSSKNLNDAGLFSTTIFGRVAEPKRSESFSYIDLKCELLHPILYKNIERVASFYTKIITGSEYAVWDEKTKSFIASNAVDGETGYSFFFSKYKEIEFTRNESGLRDLKISVLNKFRESALYDFLLVLPAGLRDIELDEAKGTLSQDEVNEHYRNIVSLSKNIDPKFKDNKFNDGTKVLMQRNFNAIYEIFFTYLDGKRGIVQEKLAKRRLEHGTRSIFTAMDLVVKELRGPQTPKITDAYCGLYQTSKGLLPITQFSFKHPLISETFLGDNSALLINPKTLVRERIKIPVNLYDRFMTEDGVNTLLNKFSKDKVRHKPVKVKGHYLAMVYRDEVGFKVITDTGRVPEDKLKKLKPITWGELIYYLLKPNTLGKPVWVTRYPITGEDSMIPNTLYLKTTFKAFPLKEYNDDWVLDDGEIIYNEWPNPDEVYIDTISVNPRLLATYGADFDGDTGSADYSMTDESIKESEGYFNNIDNWFDGDSLRNSMSTDTVVWAMTSMTSGIE